MIRKILKCVTIALDYRCEVTLKIWEFYRIVSDWMNVFLIFRQSTTNNKVFLLPEKGSFLHGIRSSRCITYLKKAETDLLIPHNYKNVFLRLFPLSKFTKVRFLQVQIVSICIKSMLKVKISLTLAIFFQNSSRMKINIAKAIFKNVK